MIDDIDALYWATGVVDGAVIESSANRQENISSSGGGRDLINHLNRTDNLSKQYAENVRTLLLDFDRVITISNPATLAKYLFAYDGKFLTIFVECDSAQDDILLLIASQLVHLPGAFIVLNDDRSTWEDFVLLGAEVVVPRKCAAEQLSNISKLMVAARQLDSQRTQQLQLSLGLAKINHQDFQLSRCNRFKYSNLTAHHLIPKLWNIYRFQDLSSKRLDEIKLDIESWDFDAHKFDADELLLVAFYIIKNALEMKELTEYRIRDEDLMSFLLLVRNKYDLKNSYHNFRHAVDVLQAVNYFLIVQGVLRTRNSETSAAAPIGSSRQKKNKSDLSPLDGLMILLGAIGHDVGHPGVTNNFLVNCGASLANTYSDRSVLENYHLASFLTVLKHAWPKVIESNRSKKLIAEAILATDMGLHFDYMKRAISNRQKESDPEEFSLLMACLLLKCADVSNVARSIEISRQWAWDLVEEFEDLEDLEISLGYKSSLPSSSPGDAREESLIRGQRGFIETFALPMFGTVARLMPDMEFAVKQIEANLKEWTG